MGFKLIKKKIVKILNFCKNFFIYFKFINCMKIKIKRNERKLCFRNFW